MKLPANPAVLALALIVSLPLSPVWAHETGDPFHRHDEEKLPPFMETLRPRVEMKSAKIELLAILYDSTLLLYADEYLTNNPLEGLAIAPSSRAQRAVAQAVGNGVYRIDAEWLRAAGSLDLNFVVRGDGINEALKGVLKVAKPGRSAADSLLKVSRSTTGGVDAQAVDAGILDAAPKALSDGSVFLPKPSQHLLGIRTRRGAVRNNAVQVSLAGRVLSHPAFKQNTGGPAANQPHVPAVADGLQSDDFSTLYAPASGAPDALGVEAVTFDPALEDQIVSAQGIFKDGQQLPLHFIGAWMHAHKYGVPLQFTLGNPASGTHPAIKLSAGQPLKVNIKTRQSVLGIALPTDAIMRGNDGVQRVWVHASAERFVSQEVDVQTLDDATVVVTAGLDAGARVVTSGAALLSQIRP